MSENQMFLYHVVYSYSQGHNSGFGSLTVELTEEITSSSVVNEVREYIETTKQSGNVVILNWKELKSW